MSCVSCHGKIPSAVDTCQKMHSKTRLISPIVFAYALAVAAFFALTSRYPGFVHHDTSEIVMWSQTGWPLGLPKHPPMLPWLMRALSLAVPVNWVTLSLLTAANIVLGAWAVWRIALLYVSEERAAVALMLYGLAPGGTFFAVKFNHNAALVSLWPLTILAFLYCLREKNFKKSALFGAAFGAMAAISMLAKYYTGILLASCFLASLASVYRIRFYRSPGAYVAVGVFALLMAPHAWWTIAHGAGTVTYAFQENLREARTPLHFLMVAPLYVAPMVLGYLGINWWLTGGTARRGASLRTRKWTEMWILVSAPFIITFTTILLFRLRGATSWALPDFAVASVMCAAMLPPMSLQEVLLLKRIAARVLLVVALSGPVAMVVAFALRDGNSMEPREELARAAGRIFEAGTGWKAAIVAGDPHSANAAAMEISSRPTVYINDAVSTWVRPEDLARKGLLIICNTRYAGCVEQAGALSAGRAGFICSVPVQRSLLWMRGPRFTGEVRVVLPEGVTIERGVAEAACKAGGADASAAGLLLR